LRKWKLTIETGKYDKITCVIHEPEVNLAMRRAQKEILNAKAHLGDLGWHLDSLVEIEPSQVKSSKEA